VSSRELPADPAGQSAQLRRTGIRRTDKEHVMRKMERFQWARELTPQEYEEFSAYLYTLEERERPLYGLTGVKSSLRRKLVGGGAHWMIVLIFRDRIVFSTRGMGSLTKESRRVTVPLSDLTSVTANDGLSRSRVKFDFRDGSKVELDSVKKDSAGVMSRFSREGIAAFDPSGLNPNALTDFWQACSHTVISSDESGQPAPTE
jgi:hypothetical protein